MGLILFLQAAIAVTATLSQEESRRPVPAEADLEKARKLVRTLFEPDYAKRSTDGRRTLARKLLDHAPTSLQDAPALYVLLDEASQLASKAGDPETALAAVAELEKRFEVDAVALKADALDALRTSARTADGAAIVAQAYLQLLESAVAHEDYDAASSAASKGSTAARKARDSALVAEFRLRSKEISTLKREYDKVRKHVATLKTSPDDPEANLAYGDYLCFTRGNWTRGLPHLAKGSDAELKDLAKKDLSAPTEALVQISVGDGWWGLVEKERNTTRKAVLAARAQYWYSKALPNLGAIARIRLEPRLAEAAKLAAKAPTSKRAPVDLLSWIDPRLDAVTNGGTWRRQGKVLYSAMDGGIRYAKIMIPCLPPDEYDLKLVVERTEDEDATFFVGLVGKRKQFTLMLDTEPDDDILSTFGMFRGEFGPDLARLVPNDKVVHEDDVLHETRDIPIVVSVRRNRLTVKAEGNVILDWKNPDYDRATVFSDMQVPNRQCLFLGARDRTVFAVKEVTLTPISGPPRRLR